MPEEEQLTQQKVVKRRGRKPKNADEPKKITGEVNANAFILAAGDIEKESLVRTQDVMDILVKSMEQAYLEWSYPGLFKDRDNPDPAKTLIQCHIQFTPDFNSFKIYDLKTVTEEDDIVDDAYQISPEDAKEYVPEPKVGDTIQIPFDITKLDKAYVRRVKQLFQSHLKDASKQAILSVYSDKIGQLIEGTVTRADMANNTYELSFGKAEGFLRRSNFLPQDKFIVGDRVLVYLSDVSERSNPPSLVVSRTNEKFIERLMDRAIPEVASGEVQIKAIAREAGRRTKVFVDSTNKNIDPIGTCLGIESSRIRTVLNEIHGEKIDVLHYYKNKALQIVEAMKPAQVIGLSCPEDFFDENVHYDELEKESGYEFPHIVAVVQNGNQGVAIGTAGVNVRLASQITLCTISVYQADQAITEGLKYMSLAELESEAKAWEERQNALDKKEEEQPAEQPVVEEEKPVAETAAPLAEEKPVEAVASEPAEQQPAEQPAEERKAEPVAEPVEEKAEEKGEPAVESQPKETEPVAKPDSTTTEMKERPVEHVEIKNKPKISLEELEEALTQKKGPSETRSYKRRFDRNKVDKTVKVETPSKASTATAMPIYTEEELKALEEEEAMEDQNEYDNYDEDLEQYDYYEDDEDKKRN